MVKNGIRIKSRKVGGNKQKNKVKNNELTTKDGMKKPSNENDGLG